MNAWLERAHAGEIVVNIGQIDRNTRRTLDAEVRAGRLERWRGRWAPVAGASMGLGPLKTCWGLPSVHAVLP